jgi:tetratricopeptide (TPR) repeat protein
LEKRTVELLPVLAADYLGLHQTEKATAEIHAMLQVADKNPALVPQLAEFLLDHGGVHDADELLHLAATRQQQTDRFLLVVARVQEQLGNHTEALGALQAILQRSPDSLEALVEAGRVLGKEQQWSDAASVLTKASALAPRRVDILEGLATAQLYAGRPKEALETAKKLRERRPHDPSTAYFMALALIGTGEWNQARPYAQKMIETHPEDRQANLAFAVISYNLNDFEEAKRRVEFCLSRNSSDPGALFYLGLIQKTEGDSEGAIKSFAKSVAVNPKNAEAQSALGGLYLQTGDLAHAREAFEQAVQLAPADPQNHYELSLVYARSGSPDKAQEQLTLFKKLRAQHIYPPANVAPPLTSSQNPPG